MHQAVRDFHKQCLALAGFQPSRVVEVGSKDLNGTIRDLFSVGTWYSETGSYYCGIDIAAGDLVDLVADFTEITLAHLPSQPDWICSAEALEHYQQWPKVIHHSFSLLAPGGYLSLTCAGPGRPPHSGLIADSIQPGEYYGNVAPGDLGVELINAGFEVILCHQAGYDTQCFARKPA